MSSPRADDANRVFAAHDALFGDDQRIVFGGFGVGPVKRAALLDLADADRRALMRRLDEDRQA
jgi:hypothetical protein